MGKIDQKHKKIDQNNPKLANTAKIGSDMTKSGQHGQKWQKMAEIG